MAAKIHVGDVGTVFEATVKDQDGEVVDISLAGSKIMIFKKPSGTVVLKGAAFVTDGTDGKMKYVTSTTADLDEAGGYELQGHVAIGAGDWHTDTVNFVVYSNLG